jgi:coronin-1B/1C/6
VTSNVETVKRPTCLVWNNNGSLLATHCEDKKIRIIDPRSGEVTLCADGHKGPKKPKL